MGVFLQVDEFEMHDKNSTLWGWPGMSPLALDETGHGVPQFPLPQGPKLCAQTYLPNTTQRTICCVLACIKAYPGNTLLQGECLAACLEQPFNPPTMCPK
jgi:hypothetical protein